MADKTTSLSIVVRTVDQATARLKAIGAQLDATTKPIRDFKSALSDLRSKSGLDDVIGGFKGVGSAIGDLLGKIAMIGGAAGLAVAGLIHIANEYDQLGKTANRLGVGVDFLAGMRDAAERAGVPIEALDEGLEAFSKSLGQARANAGKMAAFLPKISTNLHSDFGAVLLRNLKGAKDNAAAIDVLADAFSRLKDPAERAALAQKTLGDAKLADLFTQGPKGLKQLRDHYNALAPGQAKAAAEAAKVADKLHDVKAATDGVKAALLVGLGPAIEVVSAKLTKWLSGHQAEIAAWAKNIGEKLPGAIDAVSDAISDALDDISSFVDSIGGIKTVGIALAAVLVGPLLSAIATFSMALLTTPVGWFLAAIAGIALAVHELLTHLKEVKDWFLGNHFEGFKNVGEKLDTIKASAKKAREAGNDETFPGLTAAMNEAATKEETEKTIRDLKKSPLARQPAQQQLMQQEPANGTVTIQVKSDAPGTRATIAPGSKGIDLIQGYLLNLW